VVGNRDQPIGYRLSSIAFSNGEPTAARDSMESTRNVLSNADNRVCPGGCFRPVGLAWDKSNRLWMTSDSTGEIYVLQSSEFSATGGGAANSGSTSNVRAVPRVLFEGAISGTGVALVVTLLACLYSLSLVV
jgi:hypothetical protein